VWANDDGKVFHSHHLTDDFDSHGALGAITVLGYSMASAMMEE